MAGRVEGLEWLKSHKEEETREQLRLVYCTLDMVNELLKKADDNPISFRTPQEQQAFILELLGHYSRSEHYDYENKFWTSNKI